MALYGMERSRNHAFSSSHLLRYVFNDGRNKSCIEVLLVSFNSAQRVFISDWFMVWQIAYNGFLFRFQTSTKRASVKHQPGTKFDPQKDADVLRKAMKGIGTRIFVCLFLDTGTYCVSTMYEEMAKRKMKED